LKPENGNFDWLGLYIRFEVIEEIQSTSFQFWGFCF